MLENGWRQFFSHDFILSGISGLSMYPDGKICVWVLESMELIKPNLIPRLSPHANKWKAGQGLHGNEVRSSPSSVQVCAHSLFGVQFQKERHAEKCSTRHVEFCPARSNA